jgi:hypothetical protein
MPLVIDDEILHEANLSEADARVEFARRLFESGRLSIASAARLAGLDTAEFSTPVAGSARPDQPNGDAAYAAGYQRIPEVASESAAMLPHLFAPDEGWA